MKVFLFILFSCLGVQASNKTLLCFFEFDTISSSDMNRFLVEDIDANVCTHLVFCRTRLDIEKNELIKVSDTLKLCSGSEKIVSLKARNPSLKVLASLTLKPSVFESSHVKLMENRSYVDGLVDKTVRSLQQHKYDGVALKFYPSENEQLGFMNLINAMKKAFVPHGYTIVFVDKLYWTKHLNEGMDFASLGKGLDLVVLDTFNFHDPEKEPWQAAHHSPLYNQAWDKENKSVDSVVSRWIDNGFPANKILLGVPLWGNNWKLSSERTIPPAPAKMGGLPGKYTSRSGLLAYFELCQDVQKQGWQVIQDPSKTMGPYALSPASSIKEDRYWISYDDPAMAVTKAQYILSKGLGGAAVKDISYDDHRNVCGGGHNPILTAFRKTMTPEWTPSSTSALNPRLYIFVLGLLLSQCFKIA